MDDGDDITGEGETLRVGTWSLSRIAEVVGGDLHPTSVRDARPRAVSTDTRTIEPGELFVALRGEQFDGHDFADDARTSGAVGAIVERGVDLELEDDAGGDDFSLIRTDDTLEALQHLGTALWREATDDADLETIAVTGSNGKTTTKELLAALWSTRGRVHKTAGNLNNHIGLPLTLCALPVDADSLIAEMGANAPGEIAELIRMAPGDMRVVTSIGYDHVEGFGSLEGVRRAKAEIAECADESTTLIVPHAEREALVPTDHPGAVRTFGDEAGADVRVRESVGHREGGQRVTLEWGNETCVLPLDLPGDYNARNLAAAVSTLLARGEPVEADELAPALRPIDLPGGRWRRVELDKLCIVDDAYNANPSSVHASLNAFLDLDAPRDGSTYRRLAVLGEMRELGDRAEALHREVARDAAAREALDGLCLYGPFAEVMAEAARERARETLAIEVRSTHEAIADWIWEACPAFVWMKASRTAELERVIPLLEERTTARDQR